MFYTLVRLKLDDLSVSFYSITRKVYLSGGPDWVPDLMVRKPKGPDGPAGD